MLMNSVQALHHLARAGLQTLARWEGNENGNATAFRAAMRYIDKGHEVMMGEISRAIAGKPANPDAYNEAREFVLLGIEQLDKTDTTGFPVDTLAIIAAIGSVMVVREKDFTEC